MATRFVDQVGYKKITRRFYECLKCCGTIRKSSVQSHAIWHAINGAWGDIPSRPGDRPNLVVTVIERTAVTTGGSELSRFDTTIEVKEVFRS